MSKTHKREVTVTPVTDTKKHINMAALARATGVTRNHIRLVLNGERKASIRLREAIKLALPSLTSRQG